MDTATVSVTNVSFNWKCVGVRVDAISGRVSRATVRVGADQARRERVAAFMQSKGYAVAVKLDVAAEVVS
jgi:hypothetical protein